MSKANLLSGALFVVLVASGVSAAGQMSLGGSVGYGEVAVSVSENYRSGRGSSRPSGMIQIDCMHRADGISGLRLSVRYAHREFYYHCYNGGLGGGTSTDLEITGGALNLEIAPRFWFNDALHLDVGFSLGTFLWARGTGRQWSSSYSGTGVQSSSHEFNDEDVKYLCDAFDLRFLFGLGLQVELNEKWDLALRGAGSLGFISWVEGCGLKSNDFYVSAGVVREIGWGEARTREKE